MFFKKSKNKSGHSAFTITESSVITEIITDCKVSLPYHPIRDAGKKRPIIKNVKSLWDTGATNCCITKKLADELGLVAVSKAKVHHADGDTVKNVYLLNLILPNEIMFPYLPVTECESTAGKFDIIIGMQVITQGDFAITNKDGKTRISFRTPSISCIDFNDEVEPPKPVPAPGATASKPIIDNPYKGTSRNAPCPCKSGKLYKRCHGIND